MLNETETRQINESFNTLNKLLADTVVRQNAIASMARLLLKEHLDRVENPDDERARLLKIVVTETQAVSSNRLSWNQLQHENLSLLVDRTVDDLFNA
jgi:hypothetical protein